MITITNLTKKKTPSLPFEEAKNKILGKKFELSLVLAKNELMKKLNKEYRKKEYVADTLSFSYSKTEGEIFLNINPASNGINQTDKKLLFLFIHSLLHLKGFTHSQKMEEKEDMYYNMFNGA